MARSRSLIAVTIVAFLPPVSASRFIAGLAASIRSAVAVPPVRMTTSTAGELTSRLPPSSTEHGASWSASIGTPARQKHWQSTYAQSTVCGEGFTITVLPAASPATMPPHGIAIGKFHGDTTATTPFGFADKVSKLRNSRAVIA